MLKPLYTNALMFLVVIGAAGCGKAALTHRTVERAKGTGYQLGAAKDKSYSADLSTARDKFHIRAYEHAQCDVIRFTRISRTSETLRDGEVVDTQDLGSAQVAEGTEAPVPCNDRFAAGAEIALKSGTATYVLGRADRFGELDAGLSAELQSSLYGEGTPAEVTVLVERQAVATLSLAELAKHELRAQALAAELKGILDQPAPTSAQISRSYVLYEQLQQLDRNTAEIHGLVERFFELIYQRKALDADAQTKRNLEALKGAKDLLSTAGAGAVPAFVRVSINGGSPSSDVMDWALGQIALTVRSQPGICRTPFTWSTPIPHQNVASRLAFTLAHYQYDDSFASQVQALCSH